ncbi:MAG: hypothetical protein KJP00_05650 [Bacteroidia bacterium]|nr:hypothetical protein [Bacteroidia bacterium]
MSGRMYMLNYQSKIQIILFAILGMHLISCGTNRQITRLESHKNLLQTTAKSELDPEAQLEILMESFTRMMHESLDIVNPKKGVAYVKKYTEQNSASIDMILSNLDKIQKDKSTLEMLDFTIGLLRKPYMKEFQELIPRFQRKYNQFEFIMSLAGKVKKGLFNLGLKTLGL